MARGRIFLNPKKKEEMLILRIKNYSYERIAKKYKVHHTTVIYHCQQAGITLPWKLKDQMYEFIGRGVPIEEVSDRLSIPMDIINLYLALYGTNGSKVFSRRTINNRPKVPEFIHPPKYRKSAIKVKETWWTLVKKLKPVMLKIPKYVPVEQVKKPLIELETATPILTKIDDRGVEWITDGKGGWVCLGMSKEALKADLEARQRRGLELKRLQMLTY